jgi:hypothetical protein
MMEEADVTATTEALEGEGHRVLSVVTAREVLWYPVGIVLALLAASSVFVLCCPGRWIG